LTKNPQADSLAALVAARDEAREMIREIHGVIKDAKQAKKEIIEILEQGANVLVMLHVNRAIEEKVNFVDKRMAEVVEISSNQVRSNVQKIAETLKEHTDYVEDLAQTVLKLSNLVKDKVDAKEEILEIHSKRLDIQLQRLNAHDDMFIHVAHLLEEENNATNE